MCTPGLRHAALLALTLLSTAGPLAPLAVAQLPTPSITFVAIDPCRLADTRGNGFSGPFGPPSLAAGVPRDFPLVGQCGLPPATLVVSLNVTVTNPPGPGFLLLYPAGGTTPLTSTLNYLAGETVANAALAPLGPGGLTVVAGVSGSDLILDVNGYFALPGDLTLTGNLILPDTSSATAGTVFKGAHLFLHNAGAGNTFLGIDAGNFAPGSIGGNTGLGANALQSLTTGNVNTATGGDALRANTTGLANTATGSGALRSNTMGFNNTATGSAALYANLTGNHNTAVGVSALQNNTTGVGNSALGVNALFNSTGTGNTAVGFQAGLSATTGNDNVYIAHPGVAAESATIRIGASQNRAFIDGIRGITTGLANAIAVLIDSSGQLGTTNSSRRTKEAIEPMGAASQGLLRLRPVTFHYRQPAADGTQPRQYGLVAEEVAEVYPDLVAYGADGQPETVLYHVLPALLLNELQALHREVAAKTRALEELRGRLEALEGRVTAGR